MQTHEQLLYSEFKDGHREHHQAAFNAVSARLQAEALVSIAETLKEAREILEF